MPASILTNIPTQALAVLGRDPAIARILQMLAASSSTAVWRIVSVSPDQYFHHLTREIIYQQLSGKAASTIFDRFLALLPGQQLTPPSVLTLTPEALRAAGLSGAKARYIHALADAVVREQLSFAQFPQMDDEQIINQLTTVKGIGRWTAEMFLMFAMGRPDVFSYADLGLRKGFARAYQLSELPTLAQMRPVVEQWAPHRTYASVLLWALIDLENS